MGQDPEHINGMDDNRLAKITENGKPSIPKPPNTKVGHQRYRKARWIKYRTWSYGI